MFTIDNLSWIQLGSLSILGVVAVIFAYEGPNKLWNYLHRTKEGRKGPRVGWIAFLGVFIILMSIAGIVWGEEKEEFKVFSFHNVEPFFGVGNTLKQSPQCEPYMADRENNFSQTLTSNGGIRYYVTDNQIFNFFGQYLHNSCVNNQDKHTLDSVGIMLSVNLVGDYLQLHAGKAILPDEKHWYTNYVLKWNVISVSDGRGVLALKYDQKDFSSHDVEAEWNSGMVAVEFSFRMK